jgi:nitronate monooxygenase
MPIPASLSGLTIPVVGAPMFLVSGPDLVIAQCSAGIVGAFPSLNARPEAMLADWIARIRDGVATFEAAHPERRGAPFAVNLIVNQANARLAHDTEVCLREQVPIVITSLQAPGEIVPAVHAYGGLVFHDVTTVRHAEKAAEAGVDGIVLVCAGAGGHAGAMSPFALLPEVRRIFPGTILLAGAISTGQGVFAARALGADLAYLGTRFIATRESLASDAYKQMIVAAAAKDVVYTPEFTGVAGNYLLPSVTAAGLDPAALALPGTSKSYRSRDKSGVSAWRDIWSAGQGVGAIDDVPTVAVLVDRLAGEFAAARDAACR